MTEPDPDADWDETVPDGWADTVRGWDWQVWREHGSKLGWRKWGPCPRCGHTMAVYQRALRSIRPTLSVSARCNCTHHHEGRQESQKGGCGPGSGLQKVTVPAAGGA